VVALLGVGAVALNQPNHPAASSVLTDPTPSTAPDGRVPWLALPVPTMPTPAGTSPSPLATARECGRNDVELADTSSDGAAGHVYTDVVVRNASASACTLSGAPGFSSLSGNAGSSGGGVTHDGSKGPDGQTPATIKPQQVAHVTLDAQHGCYSTERTYTHVELVLKDGYTVAIPDTLTSTCPLVVSDWYVVPSEVGTANGGQQPFEHLTAAIEGAPLTVDPGSTLDYTVVLTNRGTRSVSVSPCPAYTERLTDGTHTADVGYGLNCAGWNGMLAPDASVRLQMKIDVPTGMSQPTTFTWALGDHSTGMVIADGLAQSAEPNLVP
jgi:hypothetical protein